MSVESGSQENAFYRVHEQYSGLCTKSRDSKTIAEDIRENRTSPASKLNKSRSQKILLEKQKLSWRKRRLGQALALISSGVW